MLAYWLLGLVPLVAIACILWVYRKKAAAQAAARSERFEQMFGAGSQRVATPAPVPGVPEAPTPRQTATPATDRPPHLYARKERLLSQSQALLFHALRAGLPEHEVFPQVSLAAVIEVPPALQGREREQRLRALTQHGVDCVVCGKDMQVVAAVDFETGNTAESRFKSECLKAAKVRYVRVNGAELPRGEELRGLVLGETG